MRRALLASALLLVLVRVAAAAATQGGPLGVSLPLFPADNWWNIDVSQAPLDPKSSNFITHIGATRTLHPDFGGCADDPCDISIYGFPYVVVSGVQASDLRTIQFDTPEESDGVTHSTETPYPFYPVPNAAITGTHWIEGGEAGQDNIQGGDRHMLIVDRDHNWLYELYNLFWDGSQWNAGSGAFFDMNTNNRRPDTWTSADAAGLAILPGLVRYDEVYGPNPIGHALRVTVRDSNGYVYPGSHNAGGASGALPMGARLRLKATKDITQCPNEGFPGDVCPAEVQKIFQAMKTYGLIVADNGSDMYISGTFDTNWDNGILNPGFDALTAGDFEVVKLGWQPPTSFLSIADASPVVEGDSGTAPATFTVTLSPAAAQAVTVHYATANGTATAGSDYVTTSGILTFSPGDTTRTISVTVNGDTAYENDETFSVSLTQPVFAGITTDAATGTILNDEPVPTLSISDVSVAEGDAGVKSAVFAVTLSGPSTLATTVQYATADGTATVAGSDYTAVSGTLTFAPGAVSKTLSVPVKTDTTFEATETFTVVLTSAVNATLAKDTGIGTILNDDGAGTFQFSKANYSASEALASATITVTRVNGKQAGATVHYTTADGSAASSGPNPDYAVTQGTLTFAANQLSLAFKVPIVNDAIHEPGETVLLSLDSPGGPGAGLGLQSTAVLTILDNDAAPTVQFMASKYTVAEKIGTAKLTVRRTGALGSPAVVHYATSPGSATGGGTDYADAIGDLTFTASGAGATTQTIQVPINQDTEGEGPEAFTVTLSLPQSPAILGALTTATVTIVDDDATVGFSSPTYAVNEATAKATITLKRTGSLLGSLTVHYSATGGTASGGGVDYTLPAEDLSFGPGASVKTFPVSITNDLGDEGTETVNLTLSSPVWSLGTAKVLGANPAVLSITDNEPTVQFSAAAYSVGEAVKSFTISVRRTGSLAGTATVHYATSDGTAVSGGPTPDYAAAAGDLTFMSGQAARTFPILLSSDTVADGSKTINLALSGLVGAAPGTPTTAVVTIKDDDKAGKVQFNATDYSVNEGDGSITIAVTRTGGTASAATVEYGTANGTATQGMDYTTSSGVLTFGLKETTKTFQVPILDDALANAGAVETVLLTLGLPGNGLALGTPSAATLWIVKE